MARLFRDRIAAAALQKKSRIVLAIDPPAGSNNNNSDIIGFAEKMIELVQEHVCAIKINFHMILPLSGAELSGINRLAHSHGLQCIADIKLNDIENTNDVAVDYLVGRMGFDSVIVNPFIGEGALQSLVKRARQAGPADNNSAGGGGGIIALVYMSHPGAGEGYGLELEGKRALFREFLERASRADTDGIVVGANRLALIKEAAGRLPIYSPGIGVQGGDAVAAAQSGSDYLIVGRSIIEAKDPLAAARELREKISAAVVRN
jgi:orotidine-5'-phosphate decarboxylase